MRGGHRGRLRRQRHCDRRKRRTRRGQRARQRRRCLAVRRGNPAACREREQDRRRLVERVREFASPLEDARAEEVDGQGSVVGKLVSLEYERADGRTQLVLIDELHGFWKCTPAVTRRHSVLAARFCSAVG